MAWKATTVPILISIHQQLSDETLSYTSGTSSVSEHWYCLTKVKTEEYRGLTYDGAIAFLSDTYNYMNYVAVVATVYRVSEIKYAEIERIDNTDGYRVRITTQTNTFYKKASE